MLNSRIIFGLALVLAVSLSDGSDSGTQSEHNYKPTIVSWPIWAKSFSSRRQHGTLEIDLDVKRYTGSICHRQQKGGSGRTRRYNLMDWDSGIVIGAYL